jgi:Zn finger protein HypA/HybF involved in hydrogenase expression
MGGIIIMPYLHCSKCDHEWESTSNTEKCDWCGAPPGKILEVETPLEKIIKDLENSFQKFFKEKKT